MLFVLPPSVRITLYLCCSFADLLLKFTIQEKGYLMILKYNVAMDKEKQKFVSVDEAHFSFTDLGL